MNRDAALATDAPTTYFIGADGVGVVERFGGERTPARFKIIQKAPGDPDALPVQAEIVVENFTPPSAEFLGYVLGIFRKVCEKHSSEMFLHLIWDPRKQRYGIAVPKSQVVSGGFLRYAPAAGKFCGSIHSHGNLGAFFSSEDDKNESGNMQTAPGLYIVMGNVMATPSVVASIAGMGLRKSIDVPAPALVEVSDRAMRWWTRTLVHQSETEMANGVVVSKTGALFQVDWTAYTTAHAPAPVKKHSTASMNGAVQRFARAAARLAEKGLLEDALFEACEDPDVEAALVNCILEDPDMMQLIRLSQTNDDTKGFFAALREQKQGEQKWSEPLLWDAEE